MQKALIQIQDLSFWTPTRVILKNIDLEIFQNRSISIIGQSGSGKSLLLKNIIGILNPSHGIVKYMGIKVNNINFEKRKEFLKNSGFLFQSGALFDSLTIEENINFFIKNNLDTKHQLNTNEIIEILDLLGLKKSILQLYPSELSGGMYKRVALARAIAHRPKILFLDEPTTGLDPVMSNMIANLVLDLKNNLDITVISVNHDIKISQKIAEEIVFISDGQILWHGPKDNLKFSKIIALEEFLKLS
ncbi:MAG: ATP-binding cassette domain-containing protein [Rickettsia sp.]|nr:ATP-binding cassette domain-containing protein [Rickettsia sp.]